MASENLPGKIRASHQEHQHILTPTRAYRREGEAELGPEDLARKGKSKYKDMTLSLQDSKSLRKSFHSGEDQENPRRNHRFQVTGSRWEPGEVQE